MFYEHKNSSTKDYFTVSKNIGADFNFPLHLHENYELMFVEEGLLRVEINGFHYDVRSGEVAFILPNQPHAFVTPEHSRTWLVIFSPDHLPELKKQLASDGMHHPVIKPETDQLYRRFLESVGSPLRVRSLLYGLAAVYCEGESEPQLATYDGAQVCRVVEYIDLHFTEQMTLSDLSKTLGYSYRYMSGVVNRFFGETLPTVLSRYRVNRACELLLESEMEITEIAFSSGFGSVRSFNRSFRELVGCTPSEYRAASHP